MMQNTASDALPWTTPNTLTTPRSTPRSTPQSALRTPQVADAEAGQRVLDQRADLAQREEAVRRLELRAEVLQAQVTYRGRDVLSPPETSRRLAGRGRRIPPNSSPLLSAVITSDLQHFTTILTTILQPQ